MNHMTEVARMLGVKLNEEFKLINDSGNIDGNSYCFTLAGIYNITHNVFEGPYTLFNLLCGNTAIKRKHLKPRNNEYYWHVGTDGSIYRNTWYDSLVTTTGDMNCYKLGNCYRTKEEAEANKDKWIKFYESDKVLDV